MHPATIPAEAAASPFLTDEQVAAELNSKPLVVRRLIAMGFLKGYRMPPGTGRWKIRPSDLEAYVVAGCPNFQMPEVDGGGGWYDIRNLANHATAFQNQVLKIINSNIPETCPFTGVKTNETYPASIPEALPAIQQLAAGPLMDSAFRLPGAKASPFKNAGEEFLAAGLLEQAYRLVKPKATDRLGTTAFGKLFDSPEAYRQIVDAAFQAQLKVVFSVRRNYPSDQIGGRCTVSFDVPYSAIVTMSLKAIETRVF